MHDVRSELASIAAPTTCLAGAADPAAPPERMRALADGIPGARLEVLDSAPHLVQLERPEAFGRVLSEHLDRARAR